MGKRPRSREAFVVEIDRMSKFVARSYFVRICLVLTVALGCVRAPQLPPAPSGEEGLQEMVGVYKYIEYSKLPLPRKPEDFNDFVDSMPTAFHRLKDGEYIVAWGVGRSSAPGAAGQVLVYEKKTPAEGGAVLLRDGTVKQMTPAEFGAAPKAK
jgi:hypothetical protein